MDYLSTTTSTTSVLVVLDWFLGAWNVFNLVSGIALSIPVDAEYKIFVTKLLYQIFQPLFKNVHTRPLLLVAINATLVTVTIYFGVLTLWTQMLVSGCVSLPITMYLQGKISELVSLGPDKLLERELSLQRQKIIDFRPPSKDFLKLVLGAAERYVDADFFGIDNVDPSQPAFFVANHQNYCIEVPMLLNKLYQSRGTFVRSLADHMHFGIPIAALVLKWMGAVDGTRANTDCLMESGQSLLVFPGGSHEVFKHSSVPKYALLWKQRLGFARMAIKHGYPIIPVASIGVEDMVDTIFDVPLGLYRKDWSFPLPGPVWPHNLQKIYYWIGEPIPTTHYNGEWENDSHAKELRDKTKTAIELGIRLLQEKQADDPHRYRLPLLKAMLS